MLHIETLFKEIVYWVNAEAPNRKRNFIVNFLSSGRPITIELEALPSWGDVKEVSYITKG